jgi:sugar phosphate isomerase/epimerase
VGIKKPPNNQEITLTLHPRLGVSTWSLNNSLSGGTPLLDIPAQVAAHGLSKLEVCHFHFPSTDTDYLARFRAAIADSGVEFYTLLIDEGDLTHSDPVERQKAIVSMCRWIDIAAECGAARVRVSAGNEFPTPENLRLSIIGLEEVCRYAKSVGVDIVTENWHALLDHPAEVISVMASLQGELGLKMDFGNWGGNRKYDDLAKIGPLAVCTHAKAAFIAPGVMDETDFARCLAICQEAEFSGPHILIFSDPGDEWTSLDLLRDFILSTLKTK